MSLLAAMYLLLRAHENHPVYQTNNDKNTRQNLSSYLLKSI